ncbi:glycoside hydrolase family 78 protein, partial [Aureobasidium melanogenum]|uniref:Glycoside hydrolase family 78 protein n=1 Tax=Aureobasidium melanogenum (strain CBS 110374) TaxID=1043003 RepID=A0A074VTC2_AURM1
MWAHLSLSLLLLCFRATSVYGGSISARAKNGTIHLRSDGTHPAHLVIDHGHDINGFTTFHIVEASGNTSAFSIAHSESRALLDNLQSDGPIAMAAAQNTYRVQHYNISASNMTHTDRLLQGGVRWQMLTLASAGDLVLSDVGMVPSYYTAKPQGSFECSNAKWTDVWDTGARTLALSMVAAESIPELWQILPEGAFIESAAPQPYAGLQAQSLTSYEMVFDVRPVLGGFSFKVLSDTLGNGIYIWVDMAKSTVKAFSGTTEDGTLLATVNLTKTSRSTRSWHHVSASVNLSRISVSLDYTPMLSFSQTSKFYGSFGIGAANGQSAIFTNLTVTSSGAEIYTSSLTSNSTLDDFLVGTNPLSGILDGARRDRIAYAGDLDVAARTVTTSSHALEYVNDTIRLLSSNQMTAGYFVPTVKIQQSPRQGLIDINQTGLIGYSFQLLSAMGEYYMVSGDVVAARAYAPAAVRMLDWAASQVLENGLFNLTDATFGGDWNYYDPSQSGVVTKFNVVYALALQEVMPMLAAADVNTSVYEKTLETLRQSIDRQLYNDILGGYLVSEAQPHGIAQDANAMAILANVPQGNYTKLQISRSMARLLFVDHGALPFSNGTTGVSKLISPFASSYHLRAAFAAQDAESATYLLDHTWVPMTLRSNANYSGCFWETLTLDGKPGLGDATSLCHAWSSGPTAVLTRHVLGIQAVAPAHREWRVVPQSLGLQWARGTQPTPYGSITVDWRYDGVGLLAMSVFSPRGTNGIVNLPIPSEKSNATGTVVTLVNGQLVSGLSFAVVDGEPFELLQYLA